MAKGKKVYPVSMEDGLHGVNIVKDKDGLFVEVEGVRVAQRGFPGTPEAGTWVSLEPGWEVVNGDDLETITIRYNAVSVH